MRDDLDGLGPVDYLVVEFPGTNVSGEPMLRLLDLVDQGVVRVLDLVVVRKDEDGSVTVLEIADLDGDGEFDVAVLEGAASGLIGSDDIGDAAAVLDPGRTAAVLLYANLWAAPFTSALRNAGAELVASGRVALPALLDSLDAAEAEPLDA
jgi:hypothetical protein